MIEPLTSEEQELLLARPVEALLTESDRASFRGQQCLITGAAGSIGAELARQIAQCRPARLALVDSYEHGLFSLEQELVEAWPDLPLDAMLCDITRPAAVRKAVRWARPSLVFHAAAYKHVTMAERAVCAAARVNVIGTAEVMAALRNSGARVVLISSDKAASPRSVMGATKRFAELVTMRHARWGLESLVVRFGNVLASSGSFVEIMRERIRQGRPVLLTDPNATRYFMTLTEAVSLVMKAATVGRVGETLWLDMGEQVRIGDLAERLIEAANRRGWPRVPIQIIGLRPGEKLIEQLVHEGPVAGAVGHSRIRVARSPALNLARCDTQLGALRRCIRQEDALGVLEVLRSAVTDFEPSLQALARARVDRVNLDDLVEAVEAGAQTA